MRKFNVGDLIIGNKHNRYNITDRYTVCEVKEILTSTEMIVKVVEKFNKPYLDCKAIFKVNPMYFRLHREGKSEIEVEISILEEKLRKLKEKKQILDKEGTLLDADCCLETTMVDTRKTSDLISISDLLKNTKISIIAEKSYNRIEVELKCLDTGIKVMGVAKTHPEDDFNFQEGTKLAYCRALEKLYGEKSKMIASSL